IIWTKNKQRYLKFLSQEKTNLYQILKRYWRKLLEELETADQAAQAKSQPSAVEDTNQRRRSIFPFTSQREPETTSNICKITGEPYLPHNLEEAFWLSVGYDHPDSLPLRFIRARKWDLDKALVMTINAVIWRRDFGVLDLIKQGESALDPAEIDLGKVYFYGFDKNGGPVAIIHVRLHNKNTVNQELTQRLTVLTLEDGRLLMKRPVETASIIMDLTGFSTIINGDITFTRFLISTLEAYYPESLSYILILNAPWVFQGFWNLVRPLLDPVVASKIHFVKAEDLPNFIQTDIPSTLDPNGTPFEFKYISPSPEEIKRVKSLKNDLTGQELAWKNFRNAAESLKDVTMRWSAPEFCGEEEEVELDEHEESNLKQKMESLNKERLQKSEIFVESYEKLAPYIR
ncbi:hypothetical protein HK096_010094, partial [Nowakowskiella sp. JEL0078]